MNRSVSIPSSPEIVETRHSAANSAFRVLHAAFIVAPVVAGLDKFTHMLVNWDQYLAPQIARMSPIGAHSLMLVVGVIEVIAGLLVALRPKIGGIVVAAWLAGIIVNLLMTGTFFDIALRDFGLMLGAIALSRLALARERGELVARS